jgi:hypothetical protein
VWGCPTDQFAGHFSNPNSHIAALTLDWLVIRFARIFPQISHIIALIGLEPLFGLVAMN